MGKLFIFLEEPQNHYHIVENMEQNLSESVGDM